MMVMSWLLDVCTRTVLFVGRFPVTSMYRGFRIGTFKHAVIFARFPVASVYETFSHLGRIQKSRSTFGLCNLYHRSMRLHNCGFYFSHPPEGLALVCSL